MEPLAASFKPFLEYFKRLEDPHVELREKARSNFITEMDKLTTAATVPVQDSDTDPGNDEADDHFMVFGGGSMIHLKSPSISRERHAT